MGGIGGIEGIDTLDANGYWGFGLLGKASLGFLYICYFLSIEIAFYYPFLTFDDDLLLPSKDSLVVYVCFGSMLVTYKICDCKVWLIFDFS